MYVVDWERINEKEVCYYNVGYKKMTDEELNKWFAELNIFDKRDIYKYWDGDDYEAY